MIYFNFVVIHNFKNVNTQIPQNKQLIPVDLENSKNNNAEFTYEFEPDEEEILDESVINDMKLRGMI